MWDFRGAEVGAGTTGIEEGGAVPRVWVKWEGGAQTVATPVLAGGLQGRTIFLSRVTLSTELPVWPGQKSV